MNTVSQLYPNCPFQVPYQLPSGRGPAVRARAAPPGGVRRQREVLLLPPNGLRGEVDERRAPAAVRDQQVSFISTYLRTVRLATTDGTKLIHQGKTTFEVCPTSMFCAPTATGTSSGCGPEGKNMM